jgi:hypothetical protein
VEDLGQFGYLQILRSGKRYDFHLITPVDDNVARNVLSGFDLDNITWDNPLSINLLGVTVSNDESNWWNEVLELSHHFGGFGGLHVGEDTGQECDNSQHDTQVQVRQIFLVLLDTETDEAEE